MIRSLIMIEVWSKKPIGDLAIKTAQRAYMVQGVDNAFPVYDSNLPATPVDPSVDVTLRDKHAEESRPASVGVDL